MAEEQGRVPFSAATVGLVELLGMLSERGLVDRGDLDAVFGLLEHALRHPDNEHALRQVHAWREQIIAHAPDALPLRPGAPYVH